MKEVMWVAHSVGYWAALTGTSRVAHSAARSAVLSVESTVVMWVALMGS